MKLLVFCSVILLLTSCIENLSENSDSRRKTSIETSEPYIISRVIDGKVNHEFRITNISESKIRILRVATSCGCATAQIERSELLPRESCSVSVEFTPAVLRKDASISVYTDNEINAVLQFRLTALFSVEDLSIAEFVPQRIHIERGKPSFVFLKITDSESAKPAFEIREMEFISGFAGVRARRATTPIDWSQLLIWDQKSIPDEYSIVYISQDQAGRRIYFLPIELMIDPSSDLSEYPCLFTTRVSWRGDRKLISTPLLINYP